MEIGEASCTVSDSPGVEVKHKEPSTAGPSSPDLASRLVRTAQLRIPLWFASSLNVCFDGLHNLVLNQGPGVRYGPNLFMPP